MVEQLHLPNGDGTGCPAARHAATGCAASARATARRRRARYARLQHAAGARLGGEVQSIMRGEPGPTLPVHMMQHIQWVPGLPLHLLSRPASGMRRFPAGVSTLATKQEPWSSVRSGTRHPASLRRISGHSAWNAEFKLDLGSSYAQLAAPARAARARLPDAVPIQTCEPDPGGNLGDLTMFCVCFA